MILIINHIESFKNKMAIEKTYTGILHRHTASIDRYTQVYTGIYRYTSIQKVHTRTLRYTNRDKFSYLKIYMHTKFDK